MHTSPPLTTVLMRVGEFNSSLIARLKLPGKIDYSQIATTKKIKLKQKKNRCRSLNSAPFGPSNDGLSKTLFRTLVPYGTVWVDKPGLFVVSGVANCAPVLWIPEFQIFQRIGNVAISTISV